MPLKALKSMGAKHQSAGTTTKTEGEVRLLRRIDEHLLFVEMDTVRYNGEMYKVGTAQGGGTVPGDEPGKVKDLQTHRPLYGAGGKHVGQINPDQSIEIYGASAGEAGAPAEKTSKPRFPPKPVGYDVSWENPRAAAGITLTGSPSIGSGRTGKFFPFDEADQQCVPCAGRGFLPNAVEGEKPKPCPTCHGIGRRNKRVEEFARAMTRQGFKVNVRPARGKQNRQYPQAGKISPDAAIGL